MRNGTWKERLEHAWYFFIDKVIGWPYKDGKQKFKLASDGETVKSHIEPAQLPGGAFGYFQAYVLHAGIRAMSTPLFAVDYLYKLSVIADTYGKLVTP